MCIILFFLQILHGEQYIEFVGDFPATEGEFTVRNYVLDILDKGSGAIAIINGELLSFFILLFVGIVYIVRESV